MRWLINRGIPQLPSLRMDAAFWAARASWLLVSSRWPSRKKKRNQHKSNRAEKPSNRQSNLEEIQGRPMREKDKIMSTVAARYSVLSTQLRPPGQIGDRHENPKPQGSKTRPGACLETLKPAGESSSLRGIFHVRQATNLWKWAS